MASCATDGVSRRRLLDVVIWNYNYPFTYMMYMLLILNGYNILKFK